MALRKLSAVPNTNKADAFFNVSVVLKDGSIKQIGGIPLHANKAIHNQLIELKDELDRLTLQVDIHVVAESEVPQLALKDLI